MDRISLTWLIYGIVGFILGFLSINNVICSTSSTIILSLYGIIGIVLVLTIKNKQENLANYASIDKKGVANIHTTDEQQSPDLNNNKQLKLQPSQLSKCDSDNALYFNPLPHERKNDLLGTSNDPLPSKYDPFNSDLIGTYTTNQLSYKFNMA
jgi:hypothetical protein